MKIKAIISCFSEHEGGNDLIRLEKTLSHFFVHNPDIPVTVINDAGKSPKEIIKRFPNYTVQEESQNSYIRDSLCAWAGSFGILWFRRLFDFALKDDDFSHVLFLETDVLTRRQITHTPKYEMAGCGMISWDSANEFYCDYFNLPKTKHIHYYDPWQDHHNSISFLHYGTGGTIFSKSFFQKCSKNLHKIEDLYKYSTGHFLQDLAITSLAKISGCTIGEWEDLGIYGPSREWLKEKVIREETGEEALLHQYEF